MRYFLQIAYMGLNYAGWQRQLNAHTVQAELESALVTLYQQKVETVGCGRTDTGVHARQYFVHFDGHEPLPEHFIHRLNGILPPDIAVYEVYPVDSKAHARFDAVSRTYRYKVIGYKSPFEKDFSYHYMKFDRLRPDSLHAAAALIMEYDEFLPFCKTGSDAKSMKCKVLRSEWIRGERSWEYHIAASRFLRGMVRLIVGMSLRVAVGELNQEDVRRALDKQMPLDKAWSVPARGLFLSEVQYSFL